MKLFIIHIIEFTFIVNLVAFQPIKHNYDTKHIKLNLQFDEQEKSLTGTATLMITPLDSNFTRCAFHAAEMDIRKVLLNHKKELEFLADSNFVFIELPQPYTPQDSLEISIFYYTTPSRGIYFNERDTTTAQVQPFQIYSHSEPVDARYWFPCYDNPADKFTSEIVATVKDNYLLISNGKLINVKKNLSSKTRTFHWRQNKPHSSYLVSLVIGDYHVIEDRWHDIPLQYYVYHNHVEDAKLCFSRTPQMLEFFSQKFGYPFPWDKYAQVLVANYKSSGMEHTSVTSLIDKIVVDKRAHIDYNSDNLISHELAHQWFGDLVTCKSWEHLWLNEGFATYAEILFLEFDKGSEAAQYHAILQQQFYHEMEESDFHYPIVYHDYLHPEEMFNHRTYQKASQVLQMLRYLIGDELFFQSLQNYLHKFAFKAVDTDDFIDIVEQTTDRNLDWFFEEWLFQGGHPEFEINYDWLEDSSTVLLFVNQTQEDSSGFVPIFRMPVGIEIVTKNETINEIREISHKQDTLRFHVTAKPLMIRFDKNNIILKKIKFIKTQDECEYQLLHDDNLWGRLNAIDQLQHNTIDTVAVIKALTQALLYDSFWAVRKKAAYTLELFKNDNLKQTFIAGCNDNNSRVRKACIHILGNYEDRQLSSLFKKIALTDSSYRVISEALYSLTKTPDSLNFDFLCKFLEMDSYNDMVRSAAFEGLRKLKDPRSIPIAMKFANDTKQPFPRRYSALKLLEDIAIGNPRVEQFLINLLDDKDTKIKQKVIQILSNFKTKNSLNALKQMEQMKLRDSVRRRLRHAIKKIEQSLLN